MPDRNSPGAKSKDLDPATVLRGYLTGTVGDGPSAGIQTGGPEDWMGPSNPLAPTAPAEVKGRRFDFPVSFNVEIRPRAYESVSFWDLQALADAYDVLRIVIETRKDQMEKLSWAIVPKKKANGDPMTAPDDPVIEEIAEFFHNPDKEDPNSDWGVWLRSLLEDVFVIDAPTIYLRKTRAGKLYSAEQIDGAIIKRVIDDWGRTPAAPLVAYQEILKGFPAVNYTADEILYLPRNRRANRVYGFGPVEQVIVTVTTGLLRETFTKNYFSEGNMPEGILDTPEGWTTDQIRQCQDWWDGLLSGNLQGRRRVRFVPNGVAKSFREFKNPELFAKFDEWLARVVCYAFSVSPTPFVQQVNRATAESAHDQALEEGLAPIQNWVKRLVDNIIRRCWPGANVEFAWSDDRDVDPTVDMTVRVGYVTKGLKTINEGRDEMGLPPVEGGDKPMVLTASGYAPIDEPEPPPATALPPGHPALGPGATDQAPPPDHRPQPKPGPNDQTLPDAAANGDGSKPPPKKEAQAAKAAATFRKGAPLRKGWWWNAPRRPQPSKARGPAGGETP